MFTLFNLQGTPGVFLRFCSAFHRGFTLYAELLYLSTLSLICQALFFLTFSTCGLDLLPSRRVLAYDTSIFPLCQHLFSDFLRFFSWSIFCVSFPQNTTTSWGLFPVRILPVRAGTPPPVTSWQYHRWHEPHGTTIASGICTPAGGRRRLPTPGYGGAHRYGPTRNCGPPGGPPPDS